MKIFISLNEDNNNDDSVCYINILNIDYILRPKDTTKTIIRFKGSGNQINTTLLVKEVMRRIDVALNGIKTQKEISRASLMDFEL